MSEEWTLRVHRSNILTNNDRAHHHDKTHKEAKKALKALGAAKARQIGRFDRVRMDVEVSYPPRVYMDAANLQATLKAYVDGMTSPTGKRDKAAGFLQDDSDKFFSFSSSAMIFCRPTPAWPSLPPTATKDVRTFPRGLGPGLISRGTGVGDPEGDWPLFSNMASTWLSCATSASRAGCCCRGELYYPGNAHS